jgi:GNAT superfamily N-acetyltransferase
VPGVGDLLGAEDLQTAAQNNDWGGIGLGALAAIPGIPSFSRGVRGEARAARGVANTVADAVPTNQPMTEAKSALARYRAANPNDTGARVLSPGDEGYPTNAQWDEASQTYVALTPTHQGAYDISVGGRPAGSVSMAPNGRPFVDRIQIDPAFQRQGVGGQVYDQLEETLGVPLVPSPLGLSDEAQGFWRKRLGALDPMQAQARINQAMDYGQEFGVDAYDRLNPLRPQAAEPDYPIRAFHGSPHSFDRFSLDKIGTGEGAQAYGHGLYFAESEDVARSYRDALQQPALSLGGDIVASNPRLARMAQAYPSADSALQGARDQLARAENTLASSSDDLERMIAEADISEARATIADLEPYAGQWFDKTPTGSMYEVGINADPAAFMDWDAPIYRQPEPVRNVLREYGYDAPSAPAPIGDPALRRIVDEALRRGESPHDVGLMVDNEYDLYQQAQAYAQQRGAGEVDGYGDFVEQEAADYLSALRTREGQNAGWAYNMAARDVPRAVPGGPAMPTQRAPEISARLLEAGVPGIRYLDGGSRTAGEGSSNYVLFNDELVKILRKYGISGLSTTVGASALAEELDRRGQTQEF